MGTPWVIADGALHLSGAVGALLGDLAYRQYHQAVFTAAWPGALASEQREQQEHQMLAHPPGLPANSCSPQKALPCALSTCSAQHLQPPGTYSWHRARFHMDQWREEEGDWGEKAGDCGDPCCEVSEQHY